MNKGELVNETAGEIGVAKKEARNVLAFVSPIPSLA